MEAKRMYSKPELKSQKIELGVFGSYTDAFPAPDVITVSPPSHLRAKTSF